MPRPLLFVLVAWLRADGVQEEVEEQCEDGQSCPRKGTAMLQSKHGVQHATMVSEDAAENKYGWAFSFHAGDGGGQISATEILHVVGYKGKLFAATGHWMDTVWSAAGIMRLDSPGGTWAYEGNVYNYAERVEMLKVVTWTTNKDGQKLSSPQERLYAGFYVDYQGEGRCGINMRHDGSKTWPGTEQWYWRKAPFDPKLFSARIMTMHQDSVTGVDVMLLGTGTFGVIRGVYNGNSIVQATWSSSVESGSGGLSARALAMAVCDGRAYVTAASKVLRRNDGSSPSWSSVFDMASVDSTTVDEAVGGLRGLTAIAGPSGSKSLLFVWSPNGRSQGCFYRLDPSGNTFKAHNEGCIKQMMQKFLGKMSNGGDQKIPYVLAAYNDLLEVADGMHVAGFQALMWGRSYTEQPIVESQTTFGSSNSAYYAGAGFVVRRGAGEYEVRTPYGPRFQKSQTEPELVAVRAYAKSPFAGDDSIYMGGWDCNFFSARNTGWILRGSYDAVFQKAVPCYASDGCSAPFPTVPPTPAPTPAPTPKPTPKPTPAPTPPPVRQCDLCPGSFFNSKLVADDKDGYLCGTLEAYIHSQDGASMPCSIGASWARKCCEYMPGPDPDYKDPSAGCSAQGLALSPGEHDATIFRCNGGSCISMQGVCNGYANCGDSSDEQGC